MDSAPERKGVVLSGCGPPKRLRLVESRRGSTAGVPSGAKSCMQHFTLRGNPKRKAYKPKKSQRAGKNMRYCE